MEPGKVGGAWEGGWSLGRWVGPGNEASSS